MPRGFRVHAARYKLDLIPSEELRSIANAALEDRIYSESLAQLAVTSNPIMSECGPLFEAALRELEVAVPDEAEAVWIVLRHRIAQIADGQVAPRDGMRRIVADIVRKASLHDQAKEYLGDSHGIEKLVGAFYGYDDLEEHPEEVSCQGKKGKQAIEAVDKHVVALAHEWISTHRIDLAEEPPCNGVSRKDARSDSQPHGIVADGQQRSYDANIQRVRAEVEAEYASAVKDASPWEAARLQIRIEQEVQKRMKKIAPADGLY